LFELVYVVITVILPITYNIFSPYEVYYMKVKGADTQTYHSDRLCVILL